MISVLYFFDSYPPLPSSRLEMYEMFSIIFVKILQIDDKIL